MKVAITGASGFIGTPFVRQLQTAGHTVLRIGRARAGASGGAGPDIVWDAATTLDAARLEGVDAVVHLAGESIAQRWTPEAKQRIRLSREQGTSLLPRTLAGLAHIDQDGGACLHAAGGGFEELLAVFAAACAGGGYRRNRRARAALPRSPTINPVMAKAHDTGCP